MPNLASNPNVATYRGYDIRLASCGPYRFSYAHDSFDGAPDANDNRYGYADTIEDCKSEIDDIEQEWE